MVSVPVYSVSTATIWVGFRQQQQPQPSFWFQALDTSPKHANPSSGVITTADDLSTGSIADGPNAPSRSSSQPSSYPPFSRQESKQHEITSQVVGGGRGPSLAPQPGGGSSDSGESFRNPHATARTGATDMAEELAARFPASTASYTTARRSLMCISKSECHITTQRVVVFRLASRCVNSPTGVAPGGGWTTTSAFQVDDPQVAPVSALGTTPPTSLNDGGDCVVSTKRRQLTALNNCNNRSVSFSNGQRIHSSRQQSQCSVCRVPRNPT